MKTIILLFICIVGLTSGLKGIDDSKQLKKELIAIWEEDQAIRNKYNQARKKYGEGSPNLTEILKIMRSKDSIHLVRVTSILDEKGWIGIDKIGTQANQTLFLIIQHSNLKTQQKYLPMMREAVKEGKTKNSWLALLEDRVALGEGRKQIYGSHVFWCADKQKNYVAPLDDPANVDGRRKSVGLEPLEKYLKYWKISWNLEEYQKQLPELELLYRKEKQKN